LDGRSIGPTERQQAVTKSSTVTPGMIKAGSFTETGARVWPTSQLLGDSEAPPGGDDAKWGAVSQLDLSHRYLRRLANLTQLVNLRRANLSDNDVSHQLSVS
jgi:hypothetical protein